MFRAKEFESFLGRISTRPVGKDFEGISLEEHEHSPPPSPFITSSPMLPRVGSHSRGDSASIQPTGSLARKLPLEETSPRSKASRPPLDTGLLLLTETERKPIPRRVRSIVNIDSLHQSCPLFRPISYRLAVSSERERKKK